MLASIPGRVFAFITVRLVVCLTVIKAKTRPGIEASYDARSNHNSSIYDLMRKQPLML